MKTSKLGLVVLLGVLAGCSSKESESSSSIRQDLTCGLVAAYSFDQTSGSTLNDVSGNGNNGTITSASWSTTAKSGHSLSFNGTTAVVTVPPSATLNFTGQMTIESWVRPTSLGSKWRTVLVKEAAPTDLTFGLYANENIHESSPMPAFWLRTGSDQAVPLSGMGTLSTNTWSHLAASYDGSTVRFYLNGNQISSRSQSGSIATSVGNMKIGASTMWPDNEAFSGQIDTTCIWSVARTVTQIQADMLTTDCGASTGSPCGSGGAGGSSGTSGTGGTSGTSSSSGTGGAGSGGTSGSSGSGTAGTAGVAGTSGTGGSSGGSGMAGDAGTAGSSGTAGNSGSAGDGGAGMSGSSGSAGTAGTGGVFFTTNFDLTESPISENGVWSHFGLDWTLVNTAGGFAFGTQTGNGGFDDSYAYLSGFPPDQQASAVVHRTDPVDWMTTHEVEILLRWSDSAHSARGYECNFAYDGSYAGVARWNGPKSDYTPIDSNGTPIIPGGLHEGDVVSAKMVGNVLTTYVNGNLLQTIVDNTWTDGNPGIGFWRGAPSSPQTDICFTSFTASSVP